MNKEDFLHNFAIQFDDTEESVFTMDTLFRDFDEWSSLSALSILNMVEKKYGTKLTFDELKNVNSIQELFDLVQLNSQE